MTPLTTHTLLIAATLFSLGLIGFLSRKNMILMFLSVELMLAGVATNFIAFGSHHGNVQGEIFAILILTVASCEAAMALALVVALHRRKSTLDVGAWSELRETTGPIEVEPSVREKGPSELYPTLTPAGVDPLNKQVVSKYNSGQMTQKA